MSRKSRSKPTSFFSPAGSWIRAGITLVFLLVILLSTLPVQADPERLPDMQEEQPEGYWELTGSSSDYRWEGDKFHGLDSEYVKPNAGSVLEPPMAIRYESVSRPLSSLPTYTS